MRHRWLQLLVPCALTSFFVLSVSAANPGVSLVGVGYVAGNSLDLSGLAGQPICLRDDNTVCIDQATMGGFGSAIAYTGHDNVFLAAPDRGPFDGLTNTPYLDRVHFLHIALNAGATFPNITTTLLDTRLLKKEGNTNLVGDAYAFDRRFDPEGVAIAPDGSFYISDEYGPYVFQFNRQGHLVSRVSVPAKFLLADPPAGNPSGED